jgi:simple sugar transport system substrate-binding protein
VWGGVREKMVQIGSFGPKLPMRVQTELLRLQRAMGRGSLQPFAGPILDNQDQVVLARGQSLSDKEILNMNFLVQGVQGQLP